MKDHQAPDSELQSGSISIDLDNLWSYLRNNGDENWRSFPNFLDVAVPRILDLLQKFDITATFFLVGRDMEIPGVAAQLESIVAQGHELGNHSYSHRSDIHRISLTELREEFDRCEEVIFDLTGAQPTGFRGPSFRLSPEIRAELMHRGYEYDSSLFPTLIGPIARAYHFATSNLDEDEKKKQGDLFGRWSDGFGSLEPFRWQAGKSQIIEIPVSTFPILRLPIHLTYLNFLADRSETIAYYYHRCAVEMCAARSLPYSLLLHATDFIGCDDNTCPSFLPGMKRDYRSKIKTVESVIKLAQSKFNLATIGSLASAVNANHHTRTKIIVEE